MRSGRSKLTNRKRHDLIELHRAVTRQALVLRRNLACLVGKLPRRIGEDGGETPASRKAQKVRRGIAPPFCNQCDAVGTSRDIEQLCLARHGTTTYPACTFCAALLS